MTEDALLRAIEISPPRGARLAEGELAESSKAEHRSPPALPPRPIRFCNALPDERFKFLDAHLAEFILGKTLGWCIAHRAWGPIDNVGSIVRHPPYRTAGPTSLIGDSLTSSI